MKDIKEITILAGQRVGITKQDHVIFKCSKGYDFCNPKTQTEKTFRYLKYTETEIIISDEEGKKIDSISLVVDRTKNKPSKGKTV